MKVLTEKQKSTLVKAIKMIEDVRILLQSVESNSDIQYSLNGSISDKAANLSHDILNEMQILS